MEYYFNELDPRSFQRLVNSILISRLGEDARITPLIGKDGGRDSETAEDNPYIRFDLQALSKRISPWLVPARPGRYIFQCKFHRTADSRISDLRSRVASEFATELRNNVIPLHQRENITYFFLVTNVPGSGDAIQKVDEIRRQVLKGMEGFHADVWWQDQITAHLDILPAVWKSFPSLFAGGKVPLLADITLDPARGLPRAVRLAIHNQFQRDKVVKFRQIDLAKELSKLFVDLDVDLERFRRSFSFLESTPEWIIEQSDPLGPTTAQSSVRPSALSLLLDESPTSMSKVILEGGPGQGKSTLTQMVTQVYRQKLLNTQDISPEGRWKDPQKIRLPLRIELRQYAEQVARDPQISIEKYIADLLSADAGGARIEVSSVHDIVENSPVLLVLDGLDEVGSDELRDLVLERIAETTSRLSDGLKVDLRVILTSRPPAIAGTQDKLPDYIRVPLAALNYERVNEYLNRWLTVQLHDQRERARVRSSFEARRTEPHVDALIKNPMQLSVLLHFVYLKDDAFPSRRADLYQEYFKIVIDRDVEKSAALRKQREIVEGLHRFLGFRIHALTEAQVSDGSLSRADLLRHVGSWLEERGDEKTKAPQLFKLGEERLGLIATLRGEGTSANYGFEVQPIREYFAAAHINQDLEISAHDLFEQMVRRPYWREVALFLAGLRRENEKADLIARARQIDNDNEFGWRQDGRDIILNLAKEGALSQPRHVLSDSLNFLIDLLDPEVVPVQHEPKDLIPSLAKIIAAEGQESHRHRIRSLLERYASSNDQGIVGRNFRVAGRVLPLEEIKKFALRFSSEPELMAFIRLRLPFELGLRFSATKEDDPLWAGIPDSVIAREIWEIAPQYPAISGLRIPHRIHRLLIEQFAFGGNTRNRILRSSPFPGNLAAWRLLEAGELVVGILFAHLGHLNISDHSPNVREYLDLPVSYSGLNEELASAAQAIILHTQGLLTSSLNEGQTSRASRKEILEYIRSIGPLLDKPGITSWLACRILAPFIVPTWRGQLARNFRLLLGEKSNDILKKVRELFMARQSPVPQIVFSEPTALLTERGRPATPMQELLLEFLHKDDAPELEWIRRMPVSTAHIRPLIEACQEVNLQLISKLANLRFRLTSARRPLKVAHLQKILAIARRSDDEQVIAGAITAVTGSKFLRVSGVDLLLKMLANRQKGRAMAQFVFRDPSLLGDREELLIVQLLAKSIMQDPKRFDLHTVLAAATFWAEHARNKLPTLSSPDGTIVTSRASL